MDGAAERSMLGNASTGNQDAHTVCIELQPKVVEVLDAQTDLSRGESMHGDAARSILRNTSTFN